MGIPCAEQPLVIEFKGGIIVNYPMPFNQDTISFLSTQANFPTDKLGLALNTTDLSLQVKEVKESLVPPIQIPMNCNPNGSITIDEVTVNQVSVHGAVQFVVNANLFADNTVDIPNGVNLAWPCAIGTIYVDNTILVYADDITDNYELEVKVTNLELDSGVSEGDSDLYLFIVKGSLSIQANKL